MRIIYLSIDMSGYADAYYQYDFLTAMEKVADVYKYGPGFEGYSPSDKVSDIGEKAGWGTQFDAIYLGHTWFDDVPTGDVDPRKLVIDVDRPVFAHINKEYARLQDKVTAITGHNPVVVFSIAHDLAALVGRDLPWPVVEVPLAADPEQFAPVEKRHDLFFSGILRNPTFPELQRDDRIVIQSELFNVLFGIRLRKKVKFDVFWNSFTTRNRVDRVNRYRRLEKQEYLEEMGASRMVLNALSPLNLISTRYFETMMSGAVTLCPSVVSSSRYLKHDWNCFFYDNPRQFVETVEYLLDRPEKLESIAKTARQDALANHTWESRARQVVGEMADRMNV